ncbi:MAG: glycosyltransferase family 39 protein [Nitrospira sp.]
MSVLDIQNEPRSVSWEHLLPITVCLVYLVMALYVGRDYVVGSYDNSDFYSMYAPDAKRIAKGEFPENTFNGPGYPLVLSAVTAITGDYFVSGKWIAAFSASLSGLAAYYLFRSLFGFRTAILAVIIMLVAGEYALYSIEPGTDLMFLLLCVTTMFTITCVTLGLWQKVILAGMLAGLATLTRYNGVFLPTTIVTGIVIFNCFGLPVLKRVQVAATHLVGFLVIISPWLWLNYVNRGTLLSSTNYLNMAVVFYGYQNSWEGFTQAGMVFKSFGDVLFHDPKRFLLHYLANIAKSISGSLSGEFLLVPIGVVAVAAIPLALVKLRQREIWVFLLSLFLYLLLMSFNVWETRYYLYVLVCYVGLASYLLIATADWISDNGWLSCGMTKAGLLCIGLTICSISALTSMRNIHRYINDQPYELFGASEYLKGVSVSGVRIVARKSHLAFMVDGKHVFFPMVKSLDELHESLKKSPADYLVYDTIALGRRPELKMLAEPVNTIPWLKPVYSDLQRALVIYRIEVEDASQAGAIPPSQ